MRVLILAGYTRSLTIFRGDLIKEMLRRGHDVHACAPEPDEDNSIQEMGAHFHLLPMNRAGSNPVSDMALMKKYRDIIRKLKPDVLFCYTVKPNIYGGLVGRKAGAKSVFLMVTGLGNAFIHSKGIKRKLLRALVTRMYRCAAAKSDRVIFQNPDDRREFIQMKIVPEKKTALVNGSGVNMEYFSPTPSPDSTVFLMVARLLREKGVMEYLEAVSMAKRDYPDIRALLVGPYENNGFALTEDDLRPYHRDGTVEYLGEQKDVRPFYAQASVVVLPSYREGTPRTVLEAMACGRAVITTDAPGCRETVIHGETGLLVPPRDAEALADAICRLWENPKEIKSMGREGLAYCAEKYEISKINAQMLEVFGL